MALVQPAQVKGQRSSVAPEGIARPPRMPSPAVTGGRQTVSVDIAGRLVGVSRRTIYNWIAAGKVEYRRTPGGAVRIFVDTLMRIDKRERTR